MATSPLFAPRRVFGAAVFLTLVVSVGAAPTTSTVPLAPHGDGSPNSAGQPLALSPTSVLVATRGIDNARGTADDTVLLIQDGTVTPIPVPSIKSSAGRMCRLSATSALVRSEGPDSTGYNADDVIYLLSEIGSGNVVTAIPTGSLVNTGNAAPIRLSSTSAVFSDEGPDGSAESPDDRIGLLTDLGGANTLTWLAAPSMHFSSLARPVPLSPTSFLVASIGPDEQATTADDVVYLFTDVGGSNTRTDIPTPRLQESAPGRPVRVSATRAVVISTGPDGDYSTSDDVMYLLDGLGTTNTVTPISVGSVFDYSAGRPTALSEDAVAFCSPGSDNEDGTSDDAVHMVVDLGAGNVLERVNVPGIDEDRQCRVLRLAATSFGVVCGGADTSMNSTDDELVVVTDVGGSNTTGSVSTPGIAWGSTSTPIALSSSEVLLMNGGSDGNIGTADDVVTYVSQATSTPTTQTFPTGPSSAGSYESGLVPVNLGGGRAAHLIGGPEGSVGGGGDDALRVIEGLPPTRDLDVRKLWIKFKPTKPQKGEKVQVKGVIALDTPELFAGDDVTVSIGNAAQTIPAVAFTRNKKGDFKYVDKKRVNGFVQKLIYKPRNGKLIVVGKGLGTGAETTDAAYVPVVLECAELYLGDAFAGTLVGKGIKYKAPK